MKKIICSLILLYSWSLYAQEETDYRPFIEEGKEWCSYENNMLCPFQKLRGQFVRHDYFDGDTIVAGKRCKRWRQQFIRCGTDKLSFQFTVSAYEEEKKVWFFLEGDTVQRLMFNFGAPLNNEFYIEPPDGLEWVITRLSEQEGYLAPEDNSWDTLLHRSVILYLKKDSTFYQRRQRLVEVIGTGDRGGSNWVMEGIGSCSRPDMIFDYSDAFYSSKLIYCTVGDEVLYFDERAAKYYQIPLPTSIVSPQTNNHKQRHQCFDLSGRRLAVPPAKGVYIQDGKKVAR